MLKKLLFGLGTILCSPGLVSAQQHRICGTMDRLAALEQQNPAIKAQVEKVNRDIAQWQATHNSSGQRTATTIVTIPVVVHVVYKTAVQNISDAQIQSQITGLNNDYSKLN